MNSGPKTEMESFILLIIWAPIASQIHSHSPETLVVLHDSSHVDTEQRYQQETHGGKDSVENDDSPGCYRA
jgi:hypothetical protein